MSSLSLIWHACFFSPYGKVKNKKEDMALKIYIQYMHVMIYYLENSMTDKRMLRSSKN